jgi:hypothetical protein
VESALEQQNSELREKLKPKLAFEFRSEPPFEQINILFDDTGKQTSGQQRLYRVGVRCLSPATPVDNVSVELARIEPGVIPFLPVPLHLMHDNLPADQPYKKIFDLGPDETKYIDVLYAVEGNTSVNYYDHFAVSYALQTTPNLIPARRYRFTLVARCKNYPASYADFIIEEDPQRGFRFASEHKSSSPAVAAQHGVQPTAPAGVGHRV